MKIENVSIWQNGEVKIANNFLLSIVNDNLSSSASFYYQLQNVTETIVPAIPATESNEAVEEKVVITTDTLATGNLVMDGETYQQWDADPSANEWAYNWAAAQLNLVLIP